MKSKKYNFSQRIIRAFKLNFLKLLRSPGGAKKVSLGFALGFGLEMLVISTVSLIYIFFIPIVRIAKASLPASIIGNVIGKLTFLPVVLLPLAKKLGKLIFPLSVKTDKGAQFSFSNLIHGDFYSLVHVLLGGVHVFIGMTIFATLLGLASYFIVHYFYNKQRTKRIMIRVSRKNNYAN